MPKASVIIACYNAEAFITASVTSALLQTMPDLEIIVVDDASTDNSRDVINRLSHEDRRVVPIFLHENGGPSAARNAGIRAATGDWIAILDADDLYTPDRLERLIRIAADNNADLVADNQSVRDFGSNNHVFHAYNFAQPGQVVHLDTHTFFEMAWLGYNRYDFGLMKPIMRRSFIRDNNISYDRKYRIGEDFLLYVTSVAKGGRFYATGDSHYIYHRRQGSISREGSPTFQALADMVDDILADPQLKLDATSRRLMEGRKRSLLRIVHWRTLRQLKSQKNWPRAMQYALRHPSSVSELLKQWVLWHSRKINKNPTI